MTAEEQYIENEGFSPLKNIVLPAEIAEQGKSQPLFSSCCILIDESDSVKYFGKPGFYIASRKWVKSSGLLAMYEAYNEGDMPERKGINEIPLLSPQEAFGENTEAPIPPETKVIDMAPLPPEPVADMPPAPPVDPIPDEIEVEAEEVDAIDVSDRNVFDAKGNKRDDYVVTIINNLKSVGGRAKFLGDRSISLESSSGNYVREDGFTIEGKSVSNLIKGWDFYEHFNEQAELFSKSQSDAATEKPEEAPKAISLKELAARAEQIEAIGYTLDDNEQFVVEGSPLKFSVDDVKKVSQSLWAEFVTDKTRIFQNIQEMEVKRQAEKVRLETQKEADEKERLRLEAKTKEIADKKASDELAKKKEATEPEQTTVDKKQLANEIAEELIEEVTEKEPNIFAKKITEADTKKAQEVIDQIESENQEENIPAVQEIVSKEIGKKPVYKTVEPIKNDREAISSDMDFVGRMADIFGKYAETMYAIHQMKAAVASDGTKTVKYNQIESILNDL